MITAGSVLSFITSQYLVTYQLKLMQIFKHCQIMLRVKCTIVKISNRCWNRRLNQNDSNIINTLTKDSYFVLFLPTLFVVPHE